MDRKWFDRMMARYPGEMEEEEQILHIMQMRFHDVALELTFDNTAVHPRPTDVIAEELLELATDIENMMEFLNTEWTDSLYISYKEGRIGQKTHDVG